MGGNFPGGSFPDTLYDSVLSVFKLELRFIE